MKKEGAQINREFTSKSAFSSPANNDRFNTESSVVSSHVKIKNTQKKRLLSWFCFGNRKPNRTVTVAPFSDSAVDDESKHDLDESMSRYVTRPKAAARADSQDGQSERLQAHISRHVS